jgi:4-amino-4-deoxy-L-arabinose transferase-like glycosyltransferase
MVGLSTTAETPGLAAPARLRTGSASRIRPSWLIVLVLVALVVRLIVVFATPNWLPQTDAADYDRIALSLSQHGGFGASVLDPAGGPSAFRPPAFPVALAGLYKMLGGVSASTRWESARILEAALGAVSVALIYLIGLRVFCVAAARIAGAIAAVYPPLILVGSSLMSESLFIPLMLGGVLCALSSRERASPRSWTWALGAGVLIGLAALTRSNGAVLLLPVALLVWSGRPRWSLRALRQPVLVVGATVLTLVPWTIRNASTFHELVPISTQSGYALAGIYNPIAQARTDFRALWVVPENDIRTALVGHPHSNEAQISDRLDSMALRYVAHHPGAVASTGYWNGLRLFNLTGPAVERWLARFEAYPAVLAVISVYAFWILGAVALGGVATRAVRRAPLALWGVPALILLSSVFTLGATRYRAPADPFLILLAALGLSAGWGRRLQRGRLTAPGIAGESRTMGGR